MSSTASIRFRILGAFALHAATMGAFTMRLADIQAGLGLGEAQLGIALTMSAFGALAMFLFAAPASAPGSWRSARWQWGRSPPG